MSRSRTQDDQERVRREGQRCRHRDLLRRAAHLPRRPRRAAGPLADRRDPDLGARPAATESRARPRSRSCSRVWRATSTIPPSGSATSRRPTKAPRKTTSWSARSMLQDWAEHAAPNTFSLAARMYSSLRLADRHPVVHNLVISNVPGPPIPLYFNGARLVELHPLGPVMDGAGLNVTVLSNMDAIGFGFIACRELMPELWDLADAVPGAVEELLEAAKNVEVKKAGGKKLDGRKRLRQREGRHLDGPQPAALCRVRSGGSPTRTLRAAPARTPPHRARARRGRRRLVADRTGDRRGEAALATGRDEAVAGRRRSRWSVRRPAGSTPRTRTCRSRRGRRAATRCSCCGTPPSPTGRPSRRRR